MERKNEKVDIFLLTFFIQGCRLCFFSCQGPMTHFFIVFSPEMFQNLLFLCEETKFFVPREGPKIFFVPKVGLCCPSGGKDCFCPSGGKYFFCPSGGKDCFCPSGGKDFFCPTDKKNISLPLDKNNLYLPLDKKNIYLPLDKNNLSLPQDNKAQPSGQKKSLAPPSGQKNFVSSREKEDFETFLG